jgi:hypothetical protein
VVDSVEQILVVIYCDSQSTIYTYSLVIIGGIMNESGNELQFVQLDADWVGLAEKVLVKQGMSVEEFDYQNEHGIDLTQEQKLADWWADTAEDYE